MSVSIWGPDWSAGGLAGRSGMYPLQVEAHIVNSVDRLVPGLSSVTQFARYYALYAALAAHAEKVNLNASGCRRLVRRSEAIMAAVSIVAQRSGDGPVLAHGVGRARPFLDNGFNLTEAADEERLKQSYSPREWGFWAQYGGPNQVLGTVGIEDRAFRPGRHACPAPVRELFAPLFAAAAEDRLPERRLHDLRHLAIQADEFPENRWLCGLFTATGRDGIHDPESWKTDDRRRRSAFRMVGRTSELYGDRTDLTWDEAVKATVAFGDGVKTDRVLSNIPEIFGWRGLLLRHYSVGAWRRLWAGLVHSIGQDGSGDSSRDELRAWLADAMPPGTPLRTYLDDLPPTTQNGHPAPAEQQIILGQKSGQTTDVKLLLLGSRRARELDAHALRVFLGKADILNPEWVARRVDDFMDRPVRDFAVQLVDDMLTQAQRVALAKIRPDASGMLQVPSRIHERNGRFYRTSEEGSGDIGLRLVQLFQFAGQFDLFRIAANGSARVTSDGNQLLELGA